MGGGAFLEAGNNSKRTWPKFLWVLKQTEAVFPSSSGDLKKKKKKKKVFRLGEVQKKTPLFWFKSQQVSPLQLLLANSIGGGYFHFWSKYRLQKH